MLLQEAAEWYKILLGLVPTDGNALARLGRIACKLEDQTQALHCFTEVCRKNGSGLCIDEHDGGGWWS